VLYRIYPLVPALIAVLAGGVVNGWLILVRLSDRAGSRYGMGSVRGNPKCRKTAVSANQVIAAIASPSSVSTIRP
jgi:hypothetical protein